MSRIHDALKQAEQERTGTTGSVSGAPLEVGTETSVLEASSEPVTLQSLRERCPVASWTPDRVAMLFLESTEHAPGTEEFRTLRSRLYQIREKQPLQKLLVASSLPAEGKTFVAVNLAMSIIQHPNRNVLIIDADLRLSRVHRMLGAGEGPGLAEYLAGEADVFSIVQRGLADNLFFIAGGKSLPNPVELLGTGRLRSLLNQMAPIFDWIILDSPPAVPLSDASLLAEACDGVLLVVQSGGTPYDAAQKARQEFREQHVVGVVLNRVPTGAGYTGYYYYGYGYGYGKSKTGSGNGKGK
jgi:protein-tyrosine kinase